MAEKKSQGVKWLPFILILVIAAGLWQLTPPSGLSAPAWHSAIIFVATIASIVAKVLPIGAVGIIGITVFALAYAAGDKTASGAITTALSELNSSLIWLIVVAFMIARGFIKTGLGRRIALQMIRLLGKRTLGLAYGLAFADLILSPAMPSNTARCGGVIYPIADSLARSFDSHPEDESRSKIGTFLITCIGNVNDVTAALFMTGYTGNLLAVKLAANAGVTLSWGSWFIAALLPCLVSFLIVPLLVYWLTRPEIKHTRCAGSGAQRAGANGQYGARRVAHAGDRRCVAGAMDFWQLARRGCHDGLFCRSLYFITERRAHLGRR